MKHIYPALLVLFAATPAIAQTEWERAIARGLETFTLRQGEGTVTLTCDPDRVFGSNVTNARHGL